MQSRFHAAAREYADDGQPVMPLHEGEKTPRLGRWPDRATTDLGTIDDWWTRWPNANVAIVCGDRVSYKLVVLDVDAKAGGTIPEWAPTTLTAHTPSGGWHLYYTVPLLARVRNAVSIGGTAAPGLDVRADNGYVVAPPSQLTNGVYEWDTTKHDAPVSIDPELLLPAHKRSNANGSFAYRDSVPTGERNAYLASLAGYLYALGESQGEVLDQLNAEADALGFTPRNGEIASIARSIARYH